MLEGVVGRCFGLVIPKGLDDGEGDANRLYAVCESYSMECESCAWTLTRMSGDIDRDPPMACKSMRCRQIASARKNRNSTACRTCRNELSIIFSDTNVIELTPTRSVYGARLATFLLVYNSNMFSKIMIQLTQILPA